ncbi:MAG: FHA domain-containing protein [Thermoguttaceae bacterium]|jgi:hypothetical protein|nr:FHA domain-containing protein [Thermoguttaceae bacterium]
MEVTLTVIRGKVNRGEIAFHPPAVLGRSREADLTIAHPMVSRQHCELYEVDGLLMVRDLGSLNGTVVLNRRIVESPLRPDDCFGVGPLMFRVQYHYEGDLTAVPPPKLAEPDKAAPAPAVASASQPASPEPPVFSEIGSEPVEVPAEEDGPWANALPAEEEAAPAEEDAVPVEDDADEQPAASFPQAEAGLETLPGRDGVEPTLEVPSPWSTGEDTPEVTGAEVQSSEPVGAGTRSKGVAHPAKSGSKKAKRGWNFWPFGGKKKPNAEVKGAAAAAEEPTEPPPAEQPAADGDQDESPPQTAATRDTHHDEAVADFLAEEEPEDSEPPAAELQGDEEPRPDDVSEPEDEDKPEDEDEPEDEDDAFQDFLKGLQ